MAASAEIQKRIDALDNLLKGEIRHYRIRAIGDHWLAMALMIVQSVRVYWPDSAAY